MINIDGHNLAVNLCEMLLLPLSFTLDPHLMKFFRLSRRPWMSYSINVHTEVKAADAVGLIAYFNELN